MGNLSAFQIKAKRLGILIKDARITSNISIEDCAKAMGVSLQDYESFELGEKAPSLPELEVFGYFLDTPVDYFLEGEAIPSKTEENLVIERIDNLLPLRQRIIGIMIRKARLEADISLDELAQHSKIDRQRLAEFELGTTPIPIPELEDIALALNISIRDFLDKDGPIGRWAVQKRAIEDFMALPLEMQQFISKPINLPYLELAQRLSEMSVDRLRGVAEGLLEITL
jgi:transcriptional regulator with XRE-family HTH domain